MTRRGLTLIELMIALVILGLLAAVLFPTFAAARDRRNTRACAANLSRIYRGLQLYQEDWDGQLPSHTFTTTWDQYGLTMDNCRCPSVQWDKRNDHWYQDYYQFHLDLAIPFEDRMGVYGRKTVIRRHPEWLLQEADANLPAVALMRSVMPEPESVLVFCAAHVQHGNTWPPLTVSGYYQVLRANGHVERVPIESVTYGAYGNGRWYGKEKWYPNGRRVPDDVVLIPVFPHEPWPPHFRP